MIQVKWHCERNEDFYEGIACPEGHYRVSKEEFETQCDAAGLPCENGNSCYCNPCVEAFEVNLHPYSVEGEEEQAFERIGSDLGCSKMSVCGVVEQDKDITYHVYDNLKREDTVVTAESRLGAVRKSLQVTKIAPFLYEFHFSKDEPGLAILEVFFDGVNIPQSPVQVQVTSSDCEALYPGENRMPVSLPSVLPCSVGSSLSNPFQLLSGR